MFLGLRSVVYPTPDLKASKEFFVGLLGESPSFDEPYYVKGKRERSCDHPVGLPGKCLQQEASDQPRASRVNVVVRFDPYHSHARLGRSNLGLGRALSRRPGDITSVRRNYRERPLKVCPKRGGAGRPQGADQFLKPGAR